MKNYHIAIDGVDGSGKTTQAQMLLKFLEDKGMKIFYTKFTPFSSKVLLDISFNLNKKEGSVRKIFDLSHLEYVYACDEYLNYSEIIKPKIENGFCVIQDRSKMTRYINSTIASCPKLDIEKILGSIPNPTLTVILSISPDLAFERLTLRGNRREDESLEYLNLAAELYQLQKALMPNVYYVDSSKSIEETHNNITNLITLKLEL